MERTYIENDRRSTSKESARRNPCRKERPRSTVEKMERRTGLNKPPAYMKRRKRRCMAFTGNVHTKVSDELATSILRAGEELFALR